MVPKNSKEEFAQFYLQWLYKTRSALTRPAHQAYNCRLSYPADVLHVIIKKNNMYVLHRLVLTFLLGLLIHTQLYKCTLNRYFHHTILKSNSLQYILTKLNVTLNWIIIDIFRLSVNSCSDAKSNVTCLIF